MMTLSLSRDLSFQDMDELRASRLLDDDDSPRAPWWGPHRTPDRTQMPCWRRPRRSPAHLHRPGPPPSGLTPLPGDVVQAIAEALADAVLADVQGGLTRHPHSV